MGRRVVATGVGVITPVGNTVQDFWKSLVEGKSGIGGITSFDASAYESRIAGEVKRFDPNPFISAKDQRRMELFVQFAVCATKMAIQDSGVDLSKEDAYRFGVLLGSGIGSLHVIEEQHKILLEKGPGKISPFLIPMLIVNMAPGQVSISLGLKGPNSCVATACASGSHAVGDAFQIIQRGDADAMVAGGTESCITPMGIGGFCALKALSLRNDDPPRASRPFERDRDGFVMGEGCGILILEEYERARKRGAHIYCEIVGYGMTGDAYHMTAPPQDGMGAANAMRQALERAKISPSEVHYINAHGTSTPLNDKMETVAIKQVFGEDAKKIPISSTKSMTGHLLGAAGGVEAVVCALTIQEGIIHPTINYENQDPECDLDYVPNAARRAKVDVALSNSFGFGGHNATLVFKRV
ncbi:MAG: beta-ketoacyl-ACP synthase II [Candidatus Omnitrophica bacterium]|nr:beta-ketoacyl-ACP synthase II [Candidatus Omnitrophota bacterium]